VINISLPHGFTEERKYIIEVVFKYFIGADYILIESTNASQQGEYSLQINTGEIVIIDSFFSHIKNEDNWPSIDLIPDNIDYYKNDFSIEESVPLMYGKGEIVAEQNKIVCFHDLFADIFFMLTRWEEMVIKDRDYLERFPGRSSLAYKCGFLSRPVVNEWIEMLKKMIRHIQPDFTFEPPQHYELIFTHDIDLLNRPVTIKEFAKDILKRKSLNAFFTRTGYLINRKNPYDVFDFFMDISERNNTLSRFYFMTGHNLPGKDGENYNSTPLYKSVLNKISRRGHIIGFHPSLLTYNDPDRFKKEKDQLSKDIGKPVTEGRQHALRFSIPETWRIWEENDMQTDSTMGYSSDEGFRCGTGYSFPVFDLLWRKQLKLRELPLLVMDTTLHVNRKISINESKKIINRYIDLGKKYQMPVTLLFHNLIDDSIDWRGWKDLYKEIFDQQ
jgi:hypothetical protein